MEGCTKKRRCWMAAAFARCELKLRAAGLARRGRLAGRALGLSLGLPLLRALILGAAHPLRRGFQAIADALGLRLGRFLLRRGLFRRPRVVLAADQLDLRDLGRIAAPEANPQDPGITAGPLRKPGRERVEQLADHRLVR